jgi:hypothetical protein
MADILHRYLLSRKEKKADGRLLATARSELIVVHCSATRAASIQFSGDLFFYIRSLSLYAVLLPEGGHVTCEPLMTCKSVTSPYAARKRPDLRGPPRSHRIKAGMRRGDVDWVPCLTPAV